MDTENLKIEYLETDQLKAYENNAKLHPDSQIDQIKESIRKFQMIDPIGIWSEDNIIVEGHGRLIACQQLGVKKVPVIRLDHLTDEERRAYALTHNQTTLNSGFDPEMLRVELDDIKDIDMEDLGFDMNEIEGFEAEEDDYEINPPKDPKTKLGQVWQLGKHRLMCGDATDPENIPRLSGGGTDRPIAYRPAIQRRLYRRNEGPAEDKERQNGRRSLPIISEGRVRSGRHSHASGRSLLYLACGLRGVQLQGSSQGSRVDTPAVHNLGQEQPGHGKTGLPVET